MKFMKEVFWVACTFLLISILLVTTDAKSGGSYSGGSYSGGSYSGGGYSGYSGGYSYNSGGRTYYSGSTSQTYSSNGSGLSGLWSIFVFCICICIMYRIYKKNRRNDGRGYLNQPLMAAKIAPTNEYRDAVIFSMQNPPQVTPPDYSCEVRMMVDPQASSEIFNSVRIENLGDSVIFRNQGGVEDRCVQSNVRIQGYYEVNIVSASSQVCIAMGFATKPYPSFRLPGWERHSVAYHSDNGYRFFNDPGDGSPYGPQYGQGDTIGCGYINNSNGSQTFFFTRNGQHLGQAFTTHHLSGETFAIIGADGVCTLSVNFGNNAKPYLCQAINFGVVTNPGQVSVGQYAVGGVSGQPAAQVYVGQPAAQVYVGQPAAQPYVGPSAAQPYIGQSVAQPFVGQPEGQPFVGRPEGQPLYAPPPAYAPTQNQYPAQNPIIQNKQMFIPQQSVPQQSGYNAYQPQPNQPSAPNQFVPPPQGQFTAPPPQNHYAAPPPNQQI